MMKGREGGREEGGGTVLSDENEASRKEWLGKRRRSDHLLPQLQLLQPLLLPESPPIPWDVWLWREGKQL